MKAGRELDALIAEKVMGFQRVEFLRDMLPWTFYLHEDRGVVVAFQSKLAEFKPSTNIADAWEVVDLGHPCGWFDSYYIMRYGAGYAIGRCMDDAVYAEADTAPLAICLAALKAKGVTHE